MHCKLTTKLTICNTSQYLHTAKYETLQKPKLEHINLDFSQTVIYLNRS